MRKKKNEEGKERRSKRKHHRARPLEFEGIEVTFSL